jgi:hypothetical protein
MKKNDYRLENRKHKRDLSVEMDLWIMFHKKTIETTATSNSIPICGVITNVEYFPGKSLNQCILTLENGTQYHLSVKYGKPVITNEILK